MPTNDRTLRPQRGGIVLGTLATLTLYRAVEHARRTARAGDADQAFSDLLDLVDTLADDRGGTSPRRRAPRAVGREPNLNLRA